MAHLYRESDGAGDSGSSSLLIWEENGKRKSEYGRPRVGVRVQVGSVTARSYSDQDYWQTTEVTEILEESNDRTKFKTRSGSTYIWET